MVVIICFWMSVSLTVIFCSLLTLSRVIVGLGQSGKAHINFRDSKLTRILQPSLSGNARMAVVCCATPSELYLEETRSTLMFASRAKLVKTRATVNEVLDDRSLIKKLQRELAEARLHCSVGGNDDHVVALRAQALKSGSAAFEAEEKLRKLKASILNTGALLSRRQADPKATTHKKRRLSDAQLYLNSEFSTPSKDLKNGKVTPNTAPRLESNHQQKSLNYLSPKSELSLVRCAMTAKAAQNNALMSRIERTNSVIRSTEAKLDKISFEKADLLQVSELAQCASQAISSKLMKLQGEFRDFQSSAENNFFEKDQAILKGQEQLEAERSNNKALQEQIAALECTMIDAQSSIAALSERANQLDYHLAKEKAHATDTISDLTAENHRLEQSAAQRYTEAQCTITDLMKANEELEEMAVSTKAQADSTILVHTANFKKLECDSAEKYAEAQAALADMTQANTALEQRLADTKQRADDENLELKAANERLKNGAAEMFELSEKTIADLTKLKSNLEEAVVETKAEAESKISELIAENEKMEEAATEAYTEAECRISELTEWNEKLEQELAETKLQATCVFEEKKNLHKANESLNAEKAHLENTHLIESNTASDSISKLKEMITKLEEKATNSQNKSERIITEVTHQNTQLQQIVENLGFNMKQLNERHTLESHEGSTKIAQLELSVQEASAREQILSEKLECLSLEIAECYRSVERAATEDAEKKRSILELSANLAELVAANQNKDCEYTALGKEQEHLEANLRSMNIERQLTESEMIDLRGKLTIANDLLTTIEHAHSESVAKHAVDTETILQLRDKLQAKEEEVEKTQEQAEEKWVELATKTAQYEGQIDALRSEAMELTAKKASVSEEKERVCEQHRKRVAEIVTKQAELDALHSKSKSLEGTIDKVMSANEEFKALLSQTDSNLKLAVTEIAVLHVKMEETNEREATLHIDLEKLRGALKVADDRCESLFSERTNSEIIIETLSTEIQSCKAELQNSEITIEDALKEIEDLELSLTDSRALNSEQKDRLQSISAEMVVDKEMIIELKATIHWNKEQFSELSTQLQCVNDEVSLIRQAIAEKEILTTELEYEKQSNALALKDVTQSLLDARQLVETLEVKIVTLNNERSEGRVAYGEIKVLLDVERSSVDTLKGDKTRLAEQLEVSQSQLESLLSSSQSDNLKAALISSQSEVDELTHLLLATNESVVEAREAAEFAEDELVRLEHSLGEARQRLTQNDEHLLACNARIVDLEAQVRDYGDDGTWEKRLFEKEQILEEKSKAEKLLILEVSARKESESELMRIMGEEQRVLVHEAETKMSLLRADNDQLKSTLSQVEAEAYSIKQELEEMQDQTKRLEKRSIEAEASVSFLTNDLANYEVKVATLTIENKSLAKELKRVQETRNIEVENNSAEVLHATIQLKRVEGECFLAKQKILDLEDSIRSHCDDREKAAMETREYRENVKYLKSRLSEMEQANESRSLHIKSLLDERAQSLANKENNEVTLEVGFLKKQVKELVNDIKGKDRRIKKLETVKLTKEQCDALKKMKTEREEFHQEVKDSRCKLREAAKEIAALQALNGGSGTRRNGDEVASLTFAKDALETKLRKYASHCQRLESDKATIIDALKSCNRSNIVDGDLAGAIVTLCDHFSSLEEECDALSNAEDRASSYLMEIEKIRDQMTSQQNEMATFQEKIAGLVKSEADLIGRLNEARDKITELCNERDQLMGAAKNQRGCANEKETETTRQVKYLETENLQLMLDLKATKKQLQSIRSEMDMLRMKSMIEIEDLQSFRRQPGKDLLSPEPESFVLDSISACDKENVNNSTYESCVKKSVPGSVSKRFLGNRSGSKAKRARRTSGLGESGVDEDNTQNCQQS